MSETLKIEMSGLSGVVCPSPPLDEDEIGGVTPLFSGGDWLRGDGRRFTSWGTSLGHGERIRRWGGIRRLRAGREEGRGGGGREKLRWGWGLGLLREIV